MSKVLTILLFLSVALGATAADGLWEGLTLLSPLKRSLN